MACMLLPLTSVRWRVSYTEDEPELCFQNRQLLFLCMKLTYLTFVQNYLATQGRHLTLGRISDPSRISGYYVQPQFDHLYFLNSKMKIRKDLLGFFLWMVCTSEPIALPYFTYKIISSVFRTRLKRLDSAPFTAKK